MTPQKSKPLLAVIGVTFAFLLLTTVHSFAGSQSIDNIHLSGDKLTIIKTDNKDMMFVINGRHIEWSQLTKEQQKQVRQLHNTMRETEEKLDKLDDQLDLNDTRDEYQDKIEDINDQISDINDDMNDLATEIHDAAMELEYELQKVLKSSSDNEQWHQMMNAHERLVRSHEQKIQRYEAKLRNQESKLRHKEQQLRQEEEHVRQYEAQLRIKEQEMEKQEAIVMDKMDDSIKQLISILKSVE
ncbi:hypothetical protein [Pleionea sp. CnH1-48]|uniref:hypothetical protein n=1 Tax=Pleionea sp. CnH1-48 TaxID=2954494 RepID=UPI002097EA7C|nr:hypothetical protein [Pleionea sp. CnH1-48]MCO7223192.1 hypothetical protein [Pleionea sp. CnH1-48]